MAGHGAGGRHLVGIHVVILAIVTQRHAGDHRQAALLPDRVNPPGINRGNLSDVSEIVAIGSFLAGADGHAVSAAQPYRRFLDARQRGHQLLVRMAGQDHDGEVAGLGIGHPQAVNEFAGLSHLRQHPGEGHAPAVDHRHLMFCGQ